MFNFETTNTAFFYFQGANKSKSLICPKPYRVSIVTDGTKVTVFYGLDLNASDLPKDRILKKVIMDITDDPDTYSAGHAGSLGYYLFRLRLRNVKIISCNPLTLETRFFKGLHYNMNLPLQRPNRAIFGVERGSYLPSLIKGSKATFSIVFGDWWQIYSFEEKSNGQYIVTQNIDQYSSYNISKPKIETFDNLELAKREFARLVG